MRIVHVANIGEKGQNGIDRHVLLLATEQVKHGFSVSLMVDREGQVAEACRERSIPVDIVADLRMPEPGSAPRVAKGIANSLLAKFESFNPDLIHLHTNPVAVRGIPAANIGEIPCVYTQHVNKPPGLQGVHPLVGWRQAGMSFSVICVSRRDFEDLKSCGFPAEDADYVPYGTGKVTSTPRRETSPSNRPNLILVGELTPRKRVDVAILAVEGLRRRHGRSCPVLYIYGDGAAREYLSEIVSMLEMQEVVRFCGFQRNILERCSDTDILVMSSISETGPLVVLEAMSRGMPIVATDVGDVPSMIPDPRYGRLIRTNSIAALADAVDSLISDINSGRFDPDLLIERHRLLFTNEKMAQRTEEVYRNVLAKEVPRVMTRTVR
jgi:glycosyltransferase involved in cell wall biosynthesis